MKQAKEYNFHYRAGQIPLLFTDLMLKRNGYGCFDYRILQEKNDVSAFLTKRGMKQAYDFGQKLFVKKFWKGIERRFKTAAKDFKKTAQLKRIENCTLKELQAIWRSIKKANDSFNSLYRYCEQPMQAALEEAVYKACGFDESKMTAALTKPETAIKNLSGRGKSALKLLVFLGRYKLTFHELFAAWMKAKFTLLERIAKESKLAVSQALMMRSEDVEGFFKGKIPGSETLNSRIKGCVFTPKGDSFAWLCRTGKDYLQWKERLFGSFDRTVTGTSAYPGKARGRVKVYLDWYGKINLPKGSILVSGMTNPQMVPLLVKSAAIVTDEGGLTCHAAIVARELKKPCVVGTGNATRLLKDGDLVEVDADKGIVRKIDN